MPEGLLLLPLRQVEGGITLAGEKTSATISDNERQIKENVIYFL